MHRSQTTGILHSQVKAHVHSRTKQWDMLDSHGEPSPMVHICACDSRSITKTGLPGIPRMLFIPTTAQEKALGEIARRSSC